MNLEIDILRSAIDSQERLSILLEYDDTIFKHDICRKIFIIIKDLIDNDSAVELSTIFSKFEEHGIKGDQAQELQSKIISGYPVIDIRSNINQLIKRNHIEEIRCHSVDLYNGIKNSQLSLDGALEKINEIHERLNEEIAGVNAISMSEFNNIDMDDIYTKHYFHRTGIGELDGKIIGFFDGRLITIAARPGQMKSSAVLQIIESIGYDLKKREKEAVLFSLEMGRREIYSRLLSRHAEIESWKIEAKKLNDEEMRRIIDARMGLKDRLNIKLYDNLNDFNKIKNSILYNNKIGIAAIDYLQLIEGSTGKDRRERICNITRNLKKLARRKGIPIILLSQLNRNVEYSDRDPQLSNLKESGSIEEDSDTVIFLHDDKFIIAKNRGGSTGRVQSQFEKKYFRVGLQKDIDKQSKMWE